MKKFQPSLLLIALLSLISHFSYAQQVAVSNAKKSAGTATIHLLEPKSQDGSETTSTTANAKVNAKFLQLFEQAKDQQWNTIGDCYQVSFSNNGNKARAVFTSKGNMNYLLTDCSLEQLPDAVHAKIAKDYTSYSLLQALEITAYNTVAYQVVLENTHHYITLKITGGEIEVQKETKKTL